MTGTILDDGLPETHVTYTISSDSIENDLTIESDGLTGSVYLNRDGTILVLSFVEAVELAVGILDNLCLSREDFNDDLQANVVKID